MAGSPSLVWFRQDLRCGDNPALEAARKRHQPVIPVFFWSPEEEGNWPPGAASRWWLHQSLHSLETELRERGSRLIIRQGSPRAWLPALIEETRAGAVFWNRRYEPAARESESLLQVELRALGLTVESFNAGLLFDPEEVQTRAGRPFQVFTPFWKSCLRRPLPSAPLPAPATLPAPERWPKTLPLESLKLEPKIDWTAGIRATWQPGSRGAARQLAHFLEEGLATYATERDRMDRQGTSRLSPHLHFGEISPRQIWHAVQEKQQEDPRAGVAQGAEAYLRELGWREFAHHLLYHFPYTPDQSLRPGFGDFPWREDPRGWWAWRQGLTGYPVVDAGLRELRATGWMHNRARMVVASFLVKDLLLPWTEGARWFLDTLVDADLANNTLGWQWSAGCGADAAPFFRILNPIKQGQKFDPQGNYVRRWVPELRNLPALWIHRPWEAPAAVLADAGVVLGQTYPWPRVDHPQARERALAAFGRRRKG